MKIEANKDVQAIANLKSLTRSFKTEFRKVIKVKDNIVSEALEFVESQVLPIFDKEPSLGSQILDYNFLLEFSDRRSADPFSLLRDTMLSGLKKVRLFGYIPQCFYHCSYCPFPTVLDGHQEEDALRLVREAMIFRGIIGQLPEVESLSIGGGTPTILSADGISRLIANIRSCYQIAFGVYVNMECSPDTITPEKVRACHEAGVTRLSMGVQTFDDNILRCCRRGHTGRQAEKASEMLLEQGFADLNIDLIRGLPGQSPEIFARDIKRFISTHIPSLHLYRLRLPPNHFLLGYEPYSKKYIRNVLSMQIIADRYLLEAGYTRHHSAHWTNNHNVSKVTSKPWDFGKVEVGFGMGAYSYVPSGEARNVQHVKMWRELVDREELTFKEGSLYSPKEQEMRWIKFSFKALSLDLEEYKRLFGVQFDKSLVWPKIEQLIELGILVNNGRELTFTPQGYVIAEEAIRYL